VSGDLEEQRAELIERWERGAAGWGARAAEIRAFGMPVSVWLLDALAPQPGQRVLDLAAGPGDTGFMAAELIRQPDDSRAVRSGEAGGRADGMRAGTLITSDAAEGMLEVARARAGELGIDNVEFKRLELEWIDLPTASVDAAVCRWGLMLILDPAAAAQEVRRVLRPGGRFALAVWDRGELNPWATIPTRALVELGHAPPPDPTAPAGMFALAAPGALKELLYEAGFQDVTLGQVELERTNASVAEYVQETADLSKLFGDVLGRLGERERAELLAAIERGLEPFTLPDGSIRLPARSLVAAATA
jgi:ubiquinone/menaquinone biosynthesis C-methylase UbiE